MPKKNVSDNKVEPIIPKKRGRKPKGGKIITVTESNDSKESLATNVIVHLKCKKNDIHTESLIAGNNSSNFLPTPTPTPSINNIFNTAENITNINNGLNENMNNTSGRSKGQTNREKTIHDKLKELQTNLHNNTICETNSACFWCTCEFSNLPIAIPKFEMSNAYHVYGCFCSPECAVAYLMKENIDTSTKFERYHLLSYIYSKVYDYKTNIKPAPDPHYLLKKFCGNLSIEEYRELFKSHNYLFIIDKPITRELPEFHEEFKNKNDFTFNNKNQIIHKTFSLASAN